MCKYQKLIFATKLIFCKNSKSIGNQRTSRLTSKNTHPGLIFPAASSPGLNLFKTFLHLSYIILQNWRPLTFGVMLMREDSMLTHVAATVAMVTLHFIVLRENRTDRKRRRCAKMEQLRLKINVENSNINNKNRQRHYTCNDVATMIGNSFPVRVRQWAVTRPTESFLLKTQTENTTLRIRASRARAFCAF